MRLFLLAFLCCLATYTAPVSSQKDFFKFSNFGENEGLSNTRVLKVVTDRQGFIWVATQEGLYRYDGYNFKVFKHDPENSKSLAHNYVQALFIDSFDRLWVGSRGGVLHQYNAEREEFSRFKINSGSSDSSGGQSAVFSLAEDKDGYLWVATFGAGLKQFNLKNNQFVRSYRHNPDDVGSIGDDKLYSVLIDGKGILWVGTRNGGLNRFDKVSETFSRFQHLPENPNSLSHNRVYSLLENSKGQLWVGTRGGGLNRFEPETQSFISYQHDPDKAESLASNQVWSLFEDKAGELWVGTFEGALSLFNPQTQSFEHYQHDQTNKQSLADNNVMSITQDNSGLIWVGTFGGGVSHFSPDSGRYGLVQYEPESVNGLSEGDIWAMFKDSRGILWVGSTEGLNRYDPQTDTYYSYQHDINDPYSLSDNYVKSIFEDSQGRLWVGTDKGGLNRVDIRNEHPQKYQFVHYQFEADNPQSLSDNSIQVVSQDSEQRIWVGTLQGLNLYQPETDSFRRFYHDTSNSESLSDNTVYSLLADKNGKLWIGTNNGGLNLLDPKTERFTRYLKNDDNVESISNNTVFSIAKDSKGILWLGTDGGLNRFDPESGTAKHYRIKDGLSSDGVLAVQVDSQDNLWIGGDNISRVQLYSSEKNNELEAINDIKVINYIGSQAQCSSNQGASFRDKSGTLYWGGLNQYCSFQPEAILVDSTPPAVVLTDFKLANQSVGLSDSNEQSEQGFHLKQVINHSDKITLSHKDNIFSFEFSALHFSDPKKNQYRYLLEGFSDEWIKTDWTNRRATYTDLPSGDYTFTVTATNDQGKWNDTGRNIQLTILPPPWKTWWAYSTYAVIIGLMIWYFIHSQRKQVLIEREVNEQLKQLDKLKDEFLANTSHELRTPLNAIIGLSESMICGATGELPKDTTECLHLVLNSGKRLTNLVSDILDFSQLNSSELSINTKAVNLNTIVENTIGESQGLLNDSKVLLVNEVSKNLPLVEANEDRLKQILYNLLGNGIKFTQSGSVRVKANLKGPFIDVQVVDTGIGIPEAMQQEIFKTFQQVDGSYSRKYEGTGLGLAITKKLVELHGGTIRVASKPEHGAAFTFTLPISYQ